MQQLAAIHSMVSLTGLLLLVAVLSETILYVMGGAGSWEAFLIIFVILIIAYYLLAFYFGITPLGFH